MADEKKPGDKKAPKTRRPQAQKREIQNEKRRLRNRAFKSQVRTAVRQFEEACEKKDNALVKQSLDQVYSIMDKGVKKGIFKDNKANRTKGRMAIRALAIAS
jgi:small subunit ribosomal protein S20